MSDFFVTLVLKTVIYIGKRLIFKTTKASNSNIMNQTTDVVDGY
jgi:hypothetical protein